MRLAELHYDLPSELIAQQPVTPRDASRLLVVDRARGTLEHRTFRAIVDYLHAGDALVLNNTRVLPARFLCRRRTGGRVEALFLRAHDDGWQVLLKPAARITVGEVLDCPAGGVRLVVRRRGARGEFTIRPDRPVAPFDFLARAGQTPLPPYIRRAAGGPAGVEGESRPMFEATGAPQPARVPPAECSMDAERYQTVYARAPGAVAAPTAGLHFTPALLAEIEARGAARIEVTLHVGPGTFAPITAEDLADHQMHAEYFEATREAVNLVQNTRASGGKVLAVGTTSVRVLESIVQTAALGAPGQSAGERGTDQTAPEVVSGWTDLFLYPPYRFQSVDRLLTNFHLPGSTLLALVMAFATPDLIRHAYAAAIAERYRFYSYGDAMLIL